MFKHAHIIVIFIIFIEIVLRALVIINRDKCSPFHITRFFPSLLLAPYVLTCGITTTYKTDVECGIAATMATEFVFKKKCAVRALHFGQRVVCGVFFSASVYFVELSFPRT